MKSCLALAIVLAGCGSKKQEDAPATKSGPTWTKVGKLGVQLELPANAEMTDASEKDPAVRFYVPGQCNLTVKELGTDAPGSIEEAKRRIEADTRMPLRSWTKAEATADGWILAWSATMYEGRDDFLTERRKQLGGKLFQCSGQGRLAEDAVCSARLCATLKAL